MSEWFVFIPTSCGKEAQCQLLVPEPTAGSEHSSSSPEFSLWLTIVVVTLNSLSASLCAKYYDRRAFLVHTHEAWGPESVSLSFKIRS